jgi:hypothetical protein
MRLVKLILSTLGINLFLLLFYDGGFIASLKGYINATLFFASSKAGGYMLDSASMTGFVLRRIENRKGGPYVMEWISSNSHILSLIGISTLLVILPVLFSKIISDRVKFFLILSLTSLVTPVSMAYTMIWASLAVVPFLCNDFNIESNKVRTKKNLGKKIKEHVLSKTYVKNWSTSDYVAFFCIAFILTPTFWLHWTGARNISLPRDRYPYLVVAVLAISYIEIIAASRLNPLKRSLGVVK